MAKRKRTRIRTKTWRERLRHPLVLVVAPAMIALVGVLLSSSAPSTTTSSNVGNSSTVMVGSNNSGQVAVGGVINQTQNVINSNHHDNRFEMSGVLMPANEPDPRVVSMPDNAVKIFFGGGVSGTTVLNIENILLLMGDKNMIWFRRTAEGMFFSADIIRSDGRIVAKLRDNHWEINPNNFFLLERPDRHEIRISDRTGLALRCRYLNERAIHVEGRFELPGYLPVLVTSNQIFVGGQLVPVNDFTSINMKYHYNLGTSITE